ncbi:MAG: cobalamin B12-binding domain-containing protein [Planctomycetes bacterium]|nr:cobalamin B12-binding domain-containing protein [Planctomycetota bacterium]
MSVLAPERVERPRTGRRVRKVMLVFPPMRQVTRQMKLALPPLGISYIAAVLRDRYDLELLDASVEGFHQERKLARGVIVFGLSRGQIRERIERARPDVVGASCIFSTAYPECQMILDVAKEVDPDMVTVMGGNHPTFLAEQVLAETPSCDYIVRGEGEYVMLELLEAIEKGRELRLVRGIAFRNRGQVVLTPDAPLRDDLDKIPFPARDLLPMERYFDISTGHSGAAISRRASTMLTSRGCPSRCTFCSSTVFWGNSYRVRSPENVLTEMVLLKERYGVSEIQIEDDNYTVVKSRVQEICRGMVERKLDIAWSLPNGVAVWTLTEPMLDDMKASGCYELLLAFESGSQRVLKEIVKKPLHLDRARKTVEYIQKIDIRTSSTFIVGFPGESLAEMKLTTDLAIRLDLDFAFYFVANPLPGTAMYRKCVELGLVSKDYDFANNNYFRAHFSTSDWSARQVERMAKKAFIKFLLFKLLHHPWRFTRRYRVHFRHPVLLAKLVWGKFFGR